MKNKCFLLEFVVSLLFVVSLSFTVSAAQQTQAQNPYKQQNDLKIEAPLVVEKAKHNAPPKISTAHEGELICPDQISIDNIQTQPANMTGFIGVGTANIPATFKLYGAERKSNTYCYCDYRLGGLVAILQADMTGYATCTAGYVNKPGGGGVTVQGIKRFK
jgi:hypothetical protein